MKKLYGILAVTLCLWACVSAEKREREDVILMKARITSLSDARNPADSGSTDSLDSNMDTNVSVSVIDVFIGHAQGKSVSINLKMNAWPKHKRLRDIYVLAKVEDGGKLVVVGWDYAVHGLCIDGDVARALKIENEVSDLYRQGKLASRCPR